MGEAYDKLSPRHKRFVDEYFIQNMNATQAYMEVYSPKNRNTAGAAGDRLLKNVKIDNAIKEVLAEKAMPVDEVLARLAAQARGSMGDFLHISQQGATLDLNKANQAGQMPIVQEYRQNTITHKDGTVEENAHIKLYNAQQALEKIGKAYGVFIDKSEVNAKHSWLSVDGDDYEAA